jgi:molybdopterin-guanine dinucleotide biosynthesis protein MobB
MLTDSTRPAPLILGLAGFSGSGKTSLLCHLIPRLGRVAVLKHSHHDAHDIPGSDTLRALEAGAAEAILLTENESPDPDLLAARFQGFDAVLLEGWKAGGSWPRIITNRRAIEILKTAPHAIAEVTDCEPVTGLPSFRPESIDALILFLDRICR